MWKSNRNLLEIEACLFSSEESVSACLGLSFGAELKDSEGWRLKLSAREITSISITKKDRKNTLKLDKQKCNLYYYTPSGTLNSSMETPKWGEVDKGCWRNCNCASRLLWNSRACSCSSISCLLIDLWFPVLIGTTWILHWIFQWRLPQKRKKAKHKHIANNWSCLDTN